MRFNEFESRHSTVLYLNYHRADRAIFVVVRQYLREQVMDFHLSRAAVLFVLLTILLSWLTKQAVLLTPDHQMHIT